MIQATGSTLDACGRVLGVYRISRRTWRTLWLWKTLETDAELRARIARVLL